MLVKLELSRISRINFNLISGISVLYLATNISIKTGNFSGIVGGLCGCFAPFIVVGTQARNPTKLIKFLCTITTLQQYGRFICSLIVIGLNHANSNFTNEKNWIVGRPIFISIIFERNSRINSFCCHTI